MEVWNGAIPQQELDSWLQSEAEQELPWGLCSVSEIYQYAWFFFMQYGLIPWWMQRETPATLEENIIAAVRRQEGLCRRKWMQAWAGNRLSIQRWVLQCSAAMRKTVLHAVVGEAAAKAVATAEGGLLQRFPELPAAARDRIRCVYWDALFSSLTAGRGPLRLKEKVREKWREWMPADLTEKIAQLLDDFPFPETLRGMGVVPRQHTAITDMLPDLGLDEPVRVKHAGLVLLHAALPALFGRLQWLSAGQTIAPAYHHRAVHLLAWMAGGAKQAPEYEMALHKLLCGIPLHTTIEKNVRLSAGEKAAAGALLDAAALQLFPEGNTDRQRFCSDVLQREGRLQYEAGMWKLQVAAEPARPRESDRVELPWMPQPVTVQWTT